MKSYSGAVTRVKTGSLFESLNCKVIRKPSMSDEQYEAIQKAVRERF
jgi:hypothetical protein